MRLGSPSLVWALVLISVLLALAGTDLERWMSPNEIVVRAAVVGFSLSAGVDLDGCWVYLISVVPVAAGLFALGLAFPEGIVMET